MADWMWNPVEDEDVPDGWKCCIQTAQYPICVLVTIGGIRAKTKRLYLNFGD